MRAALWFGNRFSEMVTVLVYPFACFGIYRNFSKYSWPDYFDLVLLRMSNFMADITCDSDGVVSKFINLFEEGVDTLPLHELNDQPYYLGIFLTGAYQDIMGDLHNLFGRVNEAHVFLDEDEEVGYYIEETIPGTTMEKVLALVQYGENDLARKMKRQFDKAIKEDRLRPNEAMRLLNEYTRGLKGYTYLNLE